MDRLISSENLPDSVWCSNTSEMRLPDNLVSSWKHLLIKNNLEELATKPADKGFVGGISKDDTDKHLAWRYNGSCARVILSMLDPKQELTEISNAYAALFAGNKVLLADIPSGSGAAAISILCTLAELREKNVIPRHPLEVVIVAGEISSHALGYFKEQIDFILPILAKQAIKVHSPSLLSWNILDSMSTTELIRTMTIRNIGCQNRMLILCNFSGFLTSDSSRWRTANTKFEEIFRHSTDNNSAVIWIEPQTNNAGTLFSSLKTWFSTKFSSLLPHQKKTDQLHSTVECKQSLIDGKFKVHLSVYRFDLPRKS